MELFNRFSAPQISSPYSDSSLTLRFDVYVSHRGREIGNNGEGGVHKDTYQHLIQLNFIYVAFVIIKIVSRHFTKARAWTIPSRF